MTEVQIQLQNALTTTYLANLVFLSEFDNKLYHRVEELSKMIENGSYKERYALDFIMESGDFDIYDIVNDKYLYNKKPKKENYGLIRKVQFDNKNAIFYVAEYFTTKNPFVVEKDNRFNYQSRKEFISLTQNDMFEYSNILKDHLCYDNKKLKKINKFIFLGTLLGRHIPKIAANINADMYLVLERNLEIFRLSLFITDYTILLAKKGLVFSIMEDEKDEEINISNFLNVNPWENYLIKLSSTDINVNKYVDEILSILLSMNSMSYDYNRKLYSCINRTTEVLNSHYKTLLFNQIKEKCSFFGNITILYLAAGPSLDEHIEWIKENQYKFFIVTIGAIYKKLILNEIHIDMIITLDEDITLIDLQFDNKSVSQIDKNTVVLASTITNNKILERINKNNLFLYEIFNSFHKNNLAFDGFSIGEVALDILLKMNAKKIYIIGLDLALNQETGTSHSLNSNSELSNLNLSAKQNRDTFSDTKSLIKVKGNSKNQVYTTSFFYSSIKNLEDKLKDKDNDVEIYNLSLHGAYFKGTISKNIEDLEIKNFDIVNINYFELIDVLNKNSLNGLEEESKEEIFKIIGFLNKELREHLNTIKKSDYKIYKEFYEQIILIPSMINENNFYSFFEVIINYFDMLIPYLSNHFNDIEIKSEKKKIKKIKEVFIRQIENILEDYILCLERVVK